MNYNYLGFYCTSFKVPGVPAMRIISGV